MNKLTTFVQKNFSGEEVDKKYIDWIDPSQYIGHQAQISYDTLSLMLYTKKTVKLIQDKVSEYLIGVDSKNRKIVPSERVVVQAIFGVKDRYIPKTGDIYGRYIFDVAFDRDDYTAITDQVISLLVSGIGTQIGMEQYNETLSVWTTVLGDFNDHGLRSHPVLKTKERRPDPFLISMRY